MTSPTTREGKSAVERARWVTPALIGAGGLLTAGAILALLLPALLGTAHSAAPAAAAGNLRAPRTSTTFTPPTTATIAALPEAKYDAVIAGLIPYESATAPNTPQTDTIEADTALYGTEGGKPVARLAAHNFLNQPTVVVPVQTVGSWTLVLTPARQALPSTHGGHAPAQTAGWVRTSSLTAGTTLTSRILVSVSQQTLTITDSTSKPVVFTVGVGTAGTPGTPTPTGVTGYLQARYVDASQGTGTYPIQLTSLHSAASDAPYQGAPGGLIGAHYDSAHTGNVSHGCIRLDAAALAAVNALPLGTPISITN